jgi:hypothetical protein
MNNNINITRLEVLKTSNYILPKPVKTHKITMNSHLSSFFNKITITYDTVHSD